MRQVDLISWRILIQSGLLDGNQKAIPVTGHPVNP